LVILFVALLLLTSFTILISPTSKASGETSDAIRINSNEELVAQAITNGWPGDGTPLNPYKISNLSIDITEANEGIFLGNTTLYVNVENCTFTDASGQWVQTYGIHVTNTENICIFNNTLLSNFYGIQISQSSYIQVKYNTIDNSRGTAVSVAGSSYVDVSNNTIVNSTWSGIEITYLWFYDSSENLVVVQSTLNTIANNTINGGGGVAITSNSDFNIVVNNSLVKSSIYIGWSKGNTINSNTIVDAPYEGIYLDTSSAHLEKNKLINCSFLFNFQGIYDVKAFIDQLIITQDNTINGKPFYLYKNINMNNASVPLDAGHILALNVTDLLVHDLDMNYGGVTIVFSSNVQIENINITNSLEGIDLYISKYSIVNNNKLLNSRIAISSWMQGDSYNNEIKNNTILDGGGIAVGGWYGVSKNNVISDNTIINASYGGISLYSSDIGAESTGNCIINNTIIKSQDYGISIESSDNIDVSNNTIDNSKGTGVQLFASTTCTFVNNSIRNSGRYGVHLIGSNTNVLSNNHIENSVRYGIRIENTTDLMSFNNQIYSNMLSNNNGSDSVFNISHIQAFDDGENLWNSTIKGNWWSDWFYPDNDQNGIVDVPYQIDGGTNFDYYPLTSKQTKVPRFITSPITNGRETQPYVYSVECSEVTSWSFNSNTSFLSFDDVNQTIYGTPRLFDAGTYWVNITAYNDSSSQSAWQNYSLTIVDTWGPTFTNAPGDSHITLPYSYSPTFNETAIIIDHSTNAPFLSWNNGAFVGTPGADQAGEYWMRITAQSVNGLLTTTQDSSFLIKSLWSPTFVTSPDVTGREGVAYVYQVSCNETVGWEFDTNATFLAFDSATGTVQGTPTFSDSGVYRVSVGATSIDGLLKSYQNFTISILDTWAPNLINNPANGQETIQYEYRPQFNETSNVTSFRTNAPFLVWNGTSFIGTPEIGDAGVYWLNLTAFSQNGYQSRSFNLTFTITAAWAPRFVSELPTGPFFDSLEFEYQILTNESSTYQIDTNADFLQLAVNGTVTGAMLEGIYYVNIQAISIEGHLESWQNFTLEVIKDDDSPQLTILEPIDGESLDSSLFIVHWAGMDPNGSGILEYWISVDGGSWTNMGLANHTLFNLTDGTHIITVKAVDMVGNEAESWVTIHIDTGESSNNILAMTIIAVIAIAVVAVAIVFLVIRLKK